MLQCTCGWEPWDGDESIVEPSFDEELRDWCLAHDFLLCGVCCAAVKVRGALVDWQPGNVPVPTEQLQGAAEQHLIANGHGHGFMRRSSCNRAQCNLSSSRHLRDSVSRNSANRPRSGRTLAKAIAATDSSEQQSETRLERLQPLHQTQRQTQHRKHAGLFTAVYPLQQVLRKLLQLPSPMELPILFIAKRRMNHALSQRQPQPTDQGKRRQTAQRARQALRARLRARTQTALTTLRAYR